MSINESVSPAVFKNLTIVIGLFIIYSVWQTVNNKISAVRYLEVYGESLSGDVQGEKVDLKSLPIVVSKSAVQATSGLAADDQAIEDAFRMPEPEVEEEVVEIKASAVEVLYFSYRPVVSAVSNNGAVINGVFWNLGEKIKTMPFAVDGNNLYPVLKSISRNQVVLSVDAEKMTLPFERF